MDLLAPLAVEAVTLLPYVLLVSIRVGVAFASLPAPMGGGAPIVVRAAIGFLLAATLAMAVPAPAERVVLDPIYLGLAALGEGIVGAAIGLSARAVIAAAEVAGELAGSAMGLGFAHVVDPTSGEDMLIVARITGLGATALFLALDGHHVLLAGLARSLEAAPVGDAFRALSPDSVVTALSGVFGAGLRVASPVIGALFFVQLALGLVARAATRLQVFGISFGIAVLLGLVTLHAGLASSLLGLEQDLARLPESIEAVLAGR